MLQNQKLHVIAVCSNPVRYQSRIRLTEQFIEYMEKNDDVVLYVVEAAFGHRRFEVTDAENPRHTQLRTSDEIWNKETLINIGLSRLPNDAEYVAWIDADIQFTRSDWAKEAIQALQHYDIIQPWSHAVDLGPKHELMGTAKSFCSFFSNGAYPSNNVAKYGYWHSGFAWCARRTALNKLGGPLCNGPLLDYAILGSSDFYMAHSLINNLDRSLYNDVANADARKKGFTKPYLDALFMWQRRAQTLNKNIGYIPGTIFHFHHGRKSRRFYNTRENILIENDFNPFFDLRRDVNGLLNWVVESPRQQKMRDEVRRYFRARLEDSTDID